MSPAQSAAFTQRMKEIEDIITESNQRMALVKESMKRCEEGRFSHPVWPLVKVRVDK